MGDRLSLRERLLLLVVAAVLPLAALLVWISVREMRQDVELAQSQLKFAASLIAAHQDRNVEAARNLLVTIGAMPQMRAPERASCGEFLQALHGLHPTYSNFGIVDTRGNVICHAVGRADFSLADRPYFAKVLAERRFVMGAPAFGKVSQRFIIPFGLPVVEGDKVIAVAFAALDLERVSGALAAAALPYGARVVVADRRGLVLMEHPPRTGGALGSTVVEPLLLDAARRMTAGTGEWSDASGALRVHAFAPSQAVAGESFLAAVSIDKAQVAHTMFVNLRGHLLALCVTLLAGTAAAWWLGGRVIVRPAKQILAAVHQLEQGRLDARAPFRPGAQRGEFARIGAAFNLMAESLQLRQLEVQTELGRSRSALGMLQRLQAEQATQFEQLRETQRKLIEAQRIGRVGNWELDLPSGRLWWSDEVYGLFGITPGDFDFTLAGLDRWVHPDDRPLLKPARDSALLYGNEMNVEYRVVKPDGAIAWMHEIAEARRDDQGETVWLGGVVQDITNRKKNEQAIRQLNADLETRIAERTSELTRQEQLYRTLAEQAPEVVWNTNAAGTALTFLNHAWYDLVGGTPQDWLGTSGYSAIHPQDRAAVAANWQRCAEAQSTFTGVRRIRAKDGAYHTMSYKAAPVLDEQGKVAFWVGIDADITDLKAIEGALRTANQELGAFSYSVSHDLRAPLSAIGGFSRALALKLEHHGDERVHHYLTRIQAGVEKMEQLIESLLSLSRVVRAPLSYGSVDLSALARETLEGLQLQHPERVVALRIQEGLEVQGDARLLRLVMENLLGNAWKFTSRTQGALIEVGKQENSRVFFVRDNGVGFDMAYGAKLFGAFQRLHTEAEFPGTGIGLATVRRIVARHQGRVWAESQLGQGATFRFALSEAPPPAWLASDNVA